MLLIYKVSEKIQRGNKISTLPKDKNVGSVWQFRIANARVHKEDIDLIGVTNE